LLSKQILGLSTIVPNRFIKQEIIRNVLDFLDKRDAGITLPEIRISFKEGDPSHTRIDQRQKRRFFAEQLAILAYEHFALP